jgi:ribosomal protein uL23
MAEEKTEESKVKNVKKSEKEKAVEKLEAGTAGEKSSKEKKEKQIEKSIEKVSGKTVEKSIEESKGKLEAREIREASGKEKLPLKDPFEIIMYPYLSEKSLRFVTTQNTLMFVVSRRSTKKQIKWAVERAFDVKVQRVNTYIAMDGKKRAYVKLQPEFKAADIATKFGML